MNRINPERISKNKVKVLLKISTAFSSISELRIKIENKGIKNEQKNRGFLDKDQHKNRFSRRKSN